MNFSSEQDKDKSPQPNVPRRSFTQIMVKSDAVTRPQIYGLVRQTCRSQKKQTRKNDNVRTERIVDPTMETSSRARDGNKPQLRNKTKSAQELEVQQIMDNFNCQYDDVVEAVDLDIEECMTA